MKLSMISAMAQGRVIGTGHGGIPWHLPRDIKHFRNYTRGKYLLIGRHTFEEMQGWFSDHFPIILTRQTDYTTELGSVAHTMEGAMDQARASGAGELVVCGGAGLYHTALPYADELILTLIDTGIEGTALFPDYENAAEWETLSDEAFSADKDNNHAMRIVHLRRLHPTALGTESGA